jgi:hypothetical protein
MAFQGNNNIIEINTIAHNENQGMLWALSSKFTT